MAAKENLAYDLSLFEARPEREPRQRRLRVVKAPKVRRMSVAEVLRWTAVGVFGLLAVMMVMMGHVRLTELNQAVTKAQTRLTTAQSEGVRLNMDLESRISLQKVEDYAVHKLGMQKVQNYQIQYIDINGADRVEVGAHRAFSPADLFTGLFAHLEAYFS